jgi:hypothetical protein
MDNEMIAFMAARRAAVAELYSARPDAPVVVSPERTHRTGPVRRCLARGLHRLAEMVAPAMPAPAAASR